MSEFVMTQDEVRCLRALQTHLVEYLVVGGQAVRAHGVNRETKDLDVLIANDADNAARFIAAMNTLGVIHPNLTIGAIQGQKRQINFVSWGLPLEVITAADGIDFAEASNRRIEVSVEELRVPVISREELIHMKRLAAREIDVRDVAFLEDLAAGLVATEEHR